MKDSRSRPACEITTNHYQHNSGSSMIIMRLLSHSVIFVRDADIKRPSLQKAALRSALRQSVSLSVCHIPNFVTESHEVPVQLANFH